MTEPEELAIGEAVAETPPTVSEIAADGDSIQLLMLLLLEDTCSIGDAGHLCLSLNDCVVA